MRKHTGIVALILSITALLMLAACGTSSDTTNTSTVPTATAIPTDTATATTGVTGSATLRMGSFSFSGTTNLHISAGQAVTFEDPSSGGGIHDLVTGTNGTFAAKTGAPSQFSSSSGVMFSPGDTKTITFPTAGTYPITCTIHPSMQATITVA